MSRVPDEFIAPGKVVQVFRKGKGRISWRVYNPASSPVEWQGMGMSVDGPEFFEQLASSKGPQTIAPGNSFDFWVDYRIRSNAGKEFLVNFDIVPPKNARFTSDPAMLHSTVKFQVRRSWYSPR